MPTPALPFAIEAALDIVRHAQQLALDMKGTARVEIKGDDTLVTEADRAVERYLREELAQLAPGWSFLGEEEGFSGDPDQPCWVIDPIDGTTNFARGIPIWCISVGVVAGKRPILGILAVPEQNELLWAAEGQGAWHIKGKVTRKLQVNDRVPLIQEDPVAANTTVERILDFSNVPCRLRNFGSLAYHLGLLSQGCVVANIAHYHKLYDVAAGLCLCFEAGCIARYLDGSEWHALVTSGVETLPMLCAAPNTLQYLLDNLELKIIPESVKEEHNVSAAELEEAKAEVLAEGTIPPGGIEIPEGQENDSLATSQQEPAEAPIEETVEMESISDEYMPDSPALAESETGDLEAEDGETKKDAEPKDEENEWGD